MKLTCLESLACSNEFDYQVNSLSNVCLKYLSEVGHPDRDSPLFDPGCVALGWVLCAVFLWLVILMMNEFFGDYGT